ncbi:MAG: hypothetical protein JNJ43_18535, partial [Anaerolineales bacterium]|nr:hypothetical protein [Anaerolineales bacterium]
MKTKILFSILILTLTACSPQVIVVTATPLPTLQPATETATVISASATPLPIESAFAPTNPTAAPSISTSTPLPPVTGMNNPYAVVLVLPGDILNIRAGAGVGNSVVGTLQP